MTTLINRSEIERIRIIESNTQDRFKEPGDLFIPNTKTRVRIHFKSTKIIYRDFNTLREAEDFVINNFHTLEGSILL